MYFQAVSLPVISLGLEVNTYMAGIAAYRFRFTVQGCIVDCRSLSAVSNAGHICNANGLIMLGLVLL